MRPMTQKRIAVLDRKRARPESTMWRENAHFLEKPSHFLSGTVHAARTSTRQRLHDLPIILIGPKLELGDGRTVRHWIALRSNPVAVIVRGPSVRRRWRGCPRCQPVEGDELVAKAAPIRAFDDAGWLRVVQGQTDHDETPRSTAPCCLNVPGGSGWLSRLHVRLCNTVARLTTARAIALTPRHRRIGERDGRTIRDVRRTRRPTQGSDVRSLRGQVAVSASPPERV
jgi:hypothetical protein